MHRQVKSAAQLSQGSSPIFLLNVIQRCHGDHIFILIGKSHLYILHRFHQIHKDQAHCGLIDPFPVLLTIYKGIDDVFKKVLDLQHLCNFKVQILSSLLILAENIHQKICQHIVIACHGIGYVKKLRQHHKIDCNIILTRFQDLMLRKLIEKKQLTFIHYDPFSIDDISEGALAHIQHLHKIMPVRRKIYEPGVSTHCNQSAFLEHLATVHSKSRPDV